MERQVDIAGPQRRYLTRTGSVQLSFQTPDRRGRNSEPPGDLGSLLAGLACPSDQQGSVNRPHAKPRDILDEELLYLLVVCEPVINDDGGDGLDAEQAAGERPALPFDEEIVARSVRSTPHGDGRENAELLNRPAQLSMPLTVTLPSEAILRTDPSNRDLLNLEQVIAQGLPDAHSSTFRPVISDRIGSRSRCLCHTHQPLTYIGVILSDLIAGRRNLRP